MNQKIGSLISWSAATLVVVMIAALGWTLQRLPDASDLPKTIEPRWYPRLESVPSNALRFYLVFPEAMTTGDIFTHLQLIDTEKNTPIAGAFREVELWSPDARRLTVWLHPGRQKSGVNLNEDEGPVLIEGHRYSLVLSRHATTARGTSLPADLTWDFNVGPPDHEAPHPSRWKVSAPKANTSEALRIDFDQPIDRGMAGSITVDGGQAADLVQLDDRSMTWSFIPWRKWTTGQHFIEVSPDLEDMAGNNLIRPFEVEVSPASNPRMIERKPVRIEFQVHP